MSLETCAPQSPYAVADHTAREAALRAAMTAEKAVEGLKQHEERCFEQGRQTKVAIDDHRRETRQDISELHGRVTELGEDMRDGFRSIESKISEQALAQKGNWLKVAGKILIIVGTAAVSLFVGSLIK